MKKQKISVLVLSIALGSVMLPNVGYAIDPTSTVDVTVSAGAGEGPTEENISDKEPNEGPFVIKAVSDFKYPSIPIGKTRSATLATGYDSGIEVVDVTGDGTGWNVKVAMTEPLAMTTGQKEELKGWVLQIPTKEVVSGRQVVTDQALGVPVTLTKDASKTVFKADVGKGMGRYTNIFERNGAQNSNPERTTGVQLSIPNTARAASYTGKLTWTLTNTPEA
ncbi:WxL domain-containing protein [Enterococcus crotali]|uniref:WxL domain-containing protein n=1 Tax=Enterococcus crotali TaxID=1453587 RepID=UPI0004717E5C|nr:WxL domain-containing protein [Enterococcus crotali]